MLDTQTAIKTLQIHSDNIGVVINTNTLFKEAIDLALQQLQGTLQTQLTDLEAVKAELDTANATIAALQKL